MAEATARDHRHEEAAGGKDRRQHQRDIVAHPAGRMLVGDGAVEIGPVEHGAAVAHRLGQRHPLGRRHILKIHRHGEGGGLRVAHRAIGKAGDESADLGRVEGFAIALGGDDFLRKKAHETVLRQRDGEGKRGRSDSAGTSSQGARTATIPFGDISSGRGLIAGGCAPFVGRVLPLGRRRARWSRQ